MTQKSTVSPCCIIDLTNSTVLLKLPNLKFIRYCTIPYSFEYSIFLRYCTIVFTLQYVERTTQDTEPSFFLYHYFIIYCMISQNKQQSITNVKRRSSHTYYQDEIQYFVQDSLFYAPCGDHFRLGTFLD